MTKYWTEKVEMYTANEKAERYDCKEEYTPSTKEKNNEARDFLKGLIEG